MEKNKDQRLHWAMSRPLRWLGCTIDEGIVICLGVIPGLFLINSQIILGVAFITSGVVLCFLLKKFKKLSGHFLLKSYLIAKGLLQPPSKDYPHLLGKKVGK